VLTVSEKNISVSSAKTGEDKKSDNANEVSNLFIVLIGVFIVLIYPKQYYFY